MYAYYCIRFLITSCVQERRIRIVLFIAFLLPSLRLVRYEPTRGCPIWCQVHPLDVVLISISTRPIRSFVRIHILRIEVAFFISSLFKLLGAQHNQTLLAVRIRYRAMLVTLTGIQSIENIPSKIRADGCRSRGGFEKLQSCNARRDPTIIHLDE